MSKQVIVEEAVSLLQKQLADFRNLLTRTSQLHGNLLTVENSQKIVKIREGLKNVQTTVGDLKVILLGTEKWETDAICKLGGVARLVDDTLEEEGGVARRIEQILKEKDGVARRLDEILKEEDGVDRLVQNLQVIEKDVSEIIKVHCQLAEDAGNSRLPSEGASNSPLVMERTILESSAMDELRLSFDALGCQLKLCLLYFSIFPAGSVMKKRALTYWWMGEDLVSSTAEEMGERCFQGLVASGLIQPIPRKHTSLQITRCKMDPWVRKMLISHAKRGKFSDFDGDGKPTVATDTRWVCLMNGAKQEPLGEELSTLFNVDESNLKFTKGWLRSLKKVLVLQLGRWKEDAKHHIEVEDTELLDGLGTLKQLRYLCLQGISMITGLPDSIVELSNLRVLDLRACHNLERLPQGIGYLQQLTHLDFSDCYLLEEMPRGLSALQDLRVLKGFVVTTNRSSCRLSDLTRLTRLTKLSICINGGEWEATDEDKRALKGLLSLRSLVITWGLVSSPSNKPSGQKDSKQEASFFPQGLEKLDLRCMPMEEPPVWLDPNKLETLKKLYLRGGALKKLRKSQWKTVKVVRLRFLSELRMKPTDAKHAFPNLEFGEIHKCKNMGSPSDWDECREWTVVLKQGDDLS